MKESLPNLVELNFRSVCLCILSWVLARLSGKTSVGSTVVNIEKLTVDVMNISPEVGAVEFEEL